MAGPGGCGHQIAVHHGIGERLVDVPPHGPGPDEIGLDGGVGRAAAARHHACGHENLLAVANRSQGFARLGEMTDDLEHPLVQPQVFRGRPPGMTRASYWAGSTASKSALSVKLCPRFSL